MREQCAVTGQGGRIRVDFLESPAGDVSVRILHPDGAATILGPWEVDGRPLSGEDGVRRGQCEAEDYLVARYGLAAWEK